MQINIKLYIETNKYRAVMTADDGKGNFYEKQVEKEVKASKNALELMATIDALSHIAHPSRIEITTPRNYMAAAIENKWIDRWQQDMWLTAKREPVANMELWKKLIPELRKHMVEFKII